MKPKKPRKSMVRKNARLSVQKGLIMATPRDWQDADELTNGYASADNGPTTKRSGELMPIAAPEAVRMTGAARGQEAKPRMSLIGVFGRALRETVLVMEHGLSKHPDALDWRTKTVEHHKDAMMRHILAYLDGEKADVDSHLHPLAHAACRALFIVYLETK